MALTDRVPKSAKARPSKGISVIGAGNWGSSLVAGVLAAGMPLVELVVRRVEDGARGEVVLFSEARLEAEVLWICVPDAEIAGVAEQLVARRGDLSGQTVVHSSGALTVEVLAAVKRAGATVAGIAPVFSFPTREAVPLAGVLFAVETDSDAGPAAWRKLKALVQKLGGEPLRISSARKVLYHAAATMASPLLVSALDAAVATAKLAGLSAGEAEAVVRALASGTLGNYFEKGSGRSFSGPFARGDIGTVELHLQALAAHPILDGVYRTLAGNAVESLPVRNKAGFERLLRSGRRVRRVRN